VVAAALARRDGGAWRMVNLSSAGAVTADVLAEQLPALDRLAVRRPDLVTCGVGANDLLRTPPRRLRRQLDAVASALSPGAVLLTLPEGLRGRGRSYLRWLNDGIRASALRHAHRVVAPVDRRFGPPWPGTFSGDRIHPSALGYADWADAILDALHVDLPDRHGSPGSGAGAPDVEERRGVSIRRSAGSIRA
jgi:acyl-CoA thioesterase I